LGTFGSSRGTGVEEKKKSSLQVGDVTFITGDAVASVVLLTT